MSKLFNIVKVTGFVALLALMLVSAMPATGHAAAAKVVSADADLAAVARDCSGTNDLCFTRVSDDGTITDYYLGKLLN
jgi:hypothetical protein